jgi:hypothetical protein
MVRIKLAYFVMLLLFIVTFSSCNKKNTKVEPQGVEVISFEKDIQPILTHNCLPCHPNSGGMSLKIGEAHSNLVNVISSNYAPKVRVVPFKADSSVICLKLHGMADYGLQMPLNGIPLEDSEIKIIEDWIDQGALDN